MAQWPVIVAEGRGGGRGRKEYRGGDGSPSGESSRGEEGEETDEASARMLCSILLFIFVSSVSPD